MLWKQVLTCIVLMAATAGAQTGSSAPTKKPLKAAAAASVEKNGKHRKNGPAAKVF